MREFIAGLRLCRKRLQNVFSEVNSSAGERERERWWGWRNMRTDSWKTESKSRRFKRKQSHRNSLQNLAKPTSAVNLSICKAAVRSPPLPPQCQNHHNYCKQTARGQYLITDCWDSIPLICPRSVIPNGCCRGKRADFLTPRQAVQHMRLPLYLLPADSQGHLKGSRYECKTNTFSPLNIWL